MANTWEDVGLVAPQWVLDYLNGDNTVLTRWDMPPEVKAFLDGWRGVNPTSGLVRQLQTDWNEVTNNGQNAGRPAGSSTTANTSTPVPPNPFQPPSQTTGPTGTPSQSAAAIPPTTTVPQPAATTTTQPPATTTPTTTVPAAPTTTQPTTSQQTAPTTTQQPAATTTTVPASTASTSTTVPATTGTTSGGGAQQQYVANQQVFTPTWKPEELRPLFQDITTEYYGNVSGIIAYLNDYYDPRNNVNGDPLAIKADFSAFDNVPEYTWKSSGYTWTEINALPFSFTPEMVYAVNQTLIAAGFYNSQNQPLNMSDRSDPVFLQTWNNLIAQSFINNVAPADYVSRQIDLRVANIERQIDEMDLTNLSTAMDNVARNVIGRTLTADEFEQIRSQMELFQTPDVETLGTVGPSVESELAGLETGISPEISARLQARMEQTFAAEASQRARYGAARQGLSDFQTFFRGGNIVDTVSSPSEFVQQTVEG